MDISVPHIYWLLVLCNALWSCFVMSQNTSDQLEYHTNKCFIVLFHRVILSSARIANFCTQWQILSFFFFFFFLQKLTSSLDARKWYHYRLPQKREGQNHHHHQGRNRQLPKGHPIRQPLWHVALGFGWAENLWICTDCMIGETVVMVFASNGFFVRLKITRVSVQLYPVRFLRVFHGGGGVGTVNHPPSVHWNPLSKFIHCLMRSSDESQRFLPRSCFEAASLVMRFSSFAFPIVLETWNKRFWLLSELGFSEQRPLWFLLTISNVRRYKSDCAHAEFHSILADTFVILDQNMDQNDQRHNTPCWKSRPLSFWFRVTKNIGLNVTWKHHFFWSLLPKN